MNNEVISFDNLKNGIEEAVNKSGFPLENYVLNVLKEHGWSTISNRGYIDDVTGKEREVDILAYKVYDDLKEKIKYLTTLIISCKKSDSCTWCFLARKADVNDPNIDWTPYHYTTTDKRLKLMSDQHSDLVINEYLKNQSVRNIYSFPEIIFTCQQYDRKNKTITENKKIYDSISSVIKAVNAEKISCCKRHKNNSTKRYYTFHLLSVFDGTLVKDLFEDDNIQNITSVNECNYLNRHIVNERDDFYTISFVTKENLKNKLLSFDELHNVNHYTLPKLLNAFYKDIFLDASKVDLFWNDFCDRIKVHINFRLRKHYIRDLNTMNYYYDDSLLIGIDCPDNITEEALNEINNDENLTKIIRHELEYYYRYSGKFVFEELTLPFPH